MSRKICKVASRRLGKCEHIDVSVYQWRRLVVKVSESDSSQLRKASPDSIPVAFYERPTSSTVPISNPLSTMLSEMRERRNYRKISPQNLIINVEKSTKYSMDIKVLIDCVSDSFSNEKYVEEYENHNIFL